MPGARPLAVDGVTRAGLGLRLVVPASPKGRRPAIWSLTHLNSGHRIATLHGDAAAVRQVADAVAELGDWTFGGLDGWRNVDPELPARLGQLVERFPKVLRFGGPERDRDQATAITLARA